jgi:hypothetical protein
VERPLTPPHRQRRSLAAGAGVAHCCVITAQARGIPVARSACAAAVFAAVPKDLRVIEVTAPSSGQDGCPRHLHTLELPRAGRYDSRTDGTGRGGRRGRRRCRERQQRARQLLFETPSVRYYRQASLLVWWLPEGVAKSFHRRCSSAVVPFVRLVLYRPFSKFVQAGRGRWLSYDRPRQLTGRLSQSPKFDDAH